jgi:hypothetical protein
MECFFQDRCLARFALRERRERLGQPHRRLVDRDARPITRKLQATARPVRQNISLQAGH